MGLFLQQNDERSKLQTRLAVELREKVKQAQQEPVAGDAPSELLKDEEQTRPAGMIIALISFIAVIIIGIWIFTNF